MKTKSIRTKKSLIRLAARKARASSKSSVGVGNTINAESSSPTDILNLRKSTVSEPDTSLADINTISSKLVLYCDSSNASRSQGPTGCGIAIYQDVEKIELYYGGFCESGTCNSGELDAIYHALSFVESKLNSEVNFTQISVLSNNEYAIKAIKKCADALTLDIPFRSRKNEKRILRCAEKFLEIHERFLDVSIVHLPKKQQKEGNILANVLAKQALKNKTKNMLTLQPYEHYQIEKMDQRVAMVLTEIELGQGNLAV